MYEGSLLSPCIFGHQNTSVESRIKLLYNMSVFVMAVEHMVYTNVRLVSVRFL